MFTLPHPNATLAHHAGLAGSHGAATAVAPQAEMALQRFAELLDRATLLIDRQATFVDRLRGASPKEALKQESVPPGSSIFSRLNSGLDTLGQLLDVMQNNTVAMENMA